MTKKLLVLLVLLPFAAASATSVNLWIGGEFTGDLWTDVMNVSPGAWVDIPVYAMGENPNVDVADMMFPLGINKIYFDQFNIEECRTYGSISDWDLDLFVNLNDEYQEGWTSLSFLGFANIISEDNPWGHWEAPTRILTFRAHVVEGDQLLGMIVPDAIGPGEDIRQGSANMGDIAGNSGYTINQHYASLHFVTTAIDEEVAIPDVYFLSNNYPNPFNPTTLFKYGLPEDAHVVFEIYDILGRKVETLLNEKQSAGYHEIIWNGDHISSGMYFVRMQAGDFNDTKKMVLLK